MPEAHRSQRGPHLHQQRHRLLHGCLNPYSCTASILPPGEFTVGRSLWLVWFSVSSLLHLSLALILQNKCMQSAFGPWCCWVGASRHDLVLLPGQVLGLFAFLHLVIQELFTCGVVCCVGQQAQGCSRSPPWLTPLSRLPPSSHLISPLPQQPHLKAVKDSTGVCS